MGNRPIMVVDHGRAMARRSQNSGLKEARKCNRLS
jgi:hypothetical protein